MSRLSAASSTSHDVSLQDYYNACCADSSGEEAPSNAESDADSPNPWRAWRQSPLRGRARLNLRQRHSLQRPAADAALRRRGCDAAVSVAQLKSPLVEAVRGPLLGSPRRVLLRDALCALAQRPNALFAVGVGAARRWGPRDGFEGVWADAQAACRGAALAVCAAANDSAELACLLGPIEAVLAKATAGSQARPSASVVSPSPPVSSSSGGCGLPEDAFSDYARTCCGDEALNLAARLALGRFVALARAILRDVANWALQQRQHSFGGDVMGEEVKRKPKQGHGDEDDRRQGKSLDSTWRHHWQRELEARVLPIRRLTHITTSAFGHSADCKKVEFSAAALLDFLIVQMSALQSSSTCDLYCFYMSILLHCAWPYVQLMTSAIFGFVTSIDADTWRVLLPRIFRLSFSHVRAGASDAQSAPTDVLSLVLLCVGYGPADHDRSGVTDREGRRAAFAALLSSRSFVLRRLTSAARSGRLGRGRSRKRRLTGTPKEREEKEALWQEWPSAWCGDVATAPLTLAAEGMREADATGAMRWVLLTHESRVSHDVLIAPTTEEAPLVLSMTLPAARWLTAALLVPIGQVSQRLHERRLAELLATTTLRRHTYRITSSHACDDEEEMSMSYRKGIGEETGHSPALTFRQAVSLLVDVALCRDTQRMVQQFLLRLLHEPHWWYRRDEAEYQCTGTASTFITATFADAVRGMALGQFVRLAVLPKTSSIDADTPTDDSAMEMLRTFAAFELVFAFPWDIELVLLPRSLSVAWVEAGGTRKTYTSFFWKHRRGGEAAAIEPHTRDSWSRCFGYLCSLYYAQLSLLEQRKRLQRRDVDAYNIMSALGTTRQGERHALRVARGLGSAYFQLSFAVNALLGFAQHAVGGATRELEGEMIQVGVTNSCITLCQRLDTLLLRLGTISFPMELIGEMKSGRSSEKWDKDDDVAAIAAPVRDCIAAVLTIALDPARLPVKLVTSRTQNAIESLVAAVRALPATSILHENLKPLLVLLTFNRFYGE